MLKISCFLLFLLYNYMCYSSISNTFINNTKNKKIYNLCFIFNAFIIALFLIFETNINESLFILSYFLLMTIEIKIIYNGNWLKTTLSSLYFSSNFFAMNLIYISTYSILSKTPLIEIVFNFDILLLLLTLNLFTFNFFLYISKLLFKVEFINIVMTNRNCLKFILIIASLMFFDLCFNSYLLYLETPFYLSPLLIIKMSVCCILGFITGMIYAYRFAKLQLYVDKTKDLEKDLKEDELIIEKLKNEMFVDEFTSCFTRDFVEKKLDDLLKENPFFCLAFIDIDGLKITNDVYGHDEGDFYIKAVSEILNAEFVGKVIGRMGGDEFIVVLEHTDAYATMQCVIRCFEQVNNISKLFSKPYQTSISYGIVEVLPDNKLSREELIKLADTYMYNFKKARKKNRK